MNTSTHVTPSKFVTATCTFQLEVLHPLDYMITSEEQFVSTIIPQLEKIFPDYLYDRARPYPIAVYYGKHNGEYLCALLDTWTNWKLYPSDWDDYSLVPMAVYFGYENGKHIFYLCDGSSIAERGGAVAKFVPIKNTAVGPY